MLGQIVLFASILMLKATLCFSLQQIVPTFQRRTNRFFRRMTTTRKGVDDNAVYTIDENSIRTVLPYIQNFSTFAKGRWLNREIIEVLSREFGGNTAEYWQSAILQGHVKVNNKKVDAHYKFRNSDCMLHSKHRHEPPIKGKIEFVGEDENVVAVSKPPSMPMHPGGAYRHNTLTNILRHEPIIPDQPTLHLIHRLDKVTSGLVILAKNKDVASALSKEIRENETKKTYLARVKGKFPFRLDHLKVIEEHVVATLIAAKNDNDNDDDEQDHADLLDVLPIKRSFTVDGSGPNQNKMMRSVGSSSTSQEIINYASKNNDSLGPVTREIPSADYVGQAEGVGYCIDKEGYLVLLCPVGVISYRDAIHACTSDGKQAATKFKAIGYCAQSDTTLLECQPITGRTHQIRLHVQFLGNPIANDPCYGGDLFFGDLHRRTDAIEMFKNLLRNGVLPLNKVPHLNDPEIDRIKDALIKGTLEKPNNADDNIDIMTNDNKEMQRTDETDDDYIIRTCRYCKDVKTTLELERMNLLHCDGIWLHAFKYEGKTFSFQTKFPLWAQDFK